MKMASLILLMFSLSACGAHAGPPPQEKTPTPSPPPVREPGADAPRFSFDEAKSLSLMDINQGEFRKDLGDKHYALTNVDGSFDHLFTMIFDEAQGTHIIQDKQGRILFAGRIDGVPRYAASLDIDADGSPDVLLNVAAYGNHGNGRESFELYLNENGRLVRQENPVAIVFNGGQEERAGKLTWFSDPAISAVFDGEEAKLSASTGGLQVDAVARIHEVWGHKDGAMRLLSKTSTPISMQDVHHLTFR